MHGGYVGGGATHVYGGPHFARPSAGVVSGWHGVAHPGFGRPGFEHDGFGHHHPFWGGGSWHGGFWPHTYYGWNFPWFLPVVPVGCATYWFGGVPYYYVDSVYYRYSPDYSGYVVTDPPPVADATDSSGADTQSGGTADVYIYPRNGQTDEQTSNDRYECHKWAVGQTGFDPTRSSSESRSSAAPVDYRRAMIACLDGRGYSAR
jgi:hypothetical protein